MNNSVTEHTTPFWRSNWPPPLPPLWLQRVCRLRIVVFLNSLTIPDTRFAGTHKSKLNTLFLLFFNSSINRITQRRPAIIIPVLRQLFRVSRIHSYYMAPALKVIRLSKPRLVLSRFIVLRSTFPLKGKQPFSQRPRLNELTNKTSYYKLVCRNKRLQCVSCWYHQQFILRSSFRLCHINCAFMQINESVN